MQSPGGSSKQWQPPLYSSCSEKVSGNEGALKPHALCTGEGGGFAVFSLHGMRRKNTGLDEGGLYCWFGNHGLTTMHNLEF